MALSFLMPAPTTAFAPVPNAARAPSLRASCQPTGHGDAVPPCLANGSEPLAPSGMSVGLLAAMVGFLAAKGRRQRRVSQRSSRVTPLVRQAAQVDSVAPPEGVYCEASEKCVRRKTRTVMIGNVPCGSDYPIRTQTMANTLTHEVENTVAQIKKCADAGVDIVRITVQGMREAKACEHIKKRLLEDGYTTPIVADIHFTPKVAMVAAEFCDKIRVNPGNFADGRKSFDTIAELKETDVQEAQQQIEEVFAPLVLKLKDKNTALRIGVNHGSLAERILFQYGDSPEGMVASAIEFADICRKYDYHNFVFSMKSSNPKVMVAAYRLLAKEMYDRGWDYPLHLGVTEAGGGSDGRIKSAVGIGALLLDGLGDTIRVSLTEDPEYEAHPTNSLRRVAEEAAGKGVSKFEEADGRRNGHVEKRKCEFPLDVPLNSDGSVLTKVTTQELDSYDTAQMCERFGLRFRADGDVQKDWKSVDAFVLEGTLTPSVLDKLKVLLDVPMGILCSPSDNAPEGVTFLHEASAINEQLPQRLGGHAVVVTGEESAAEIERVVSLADPRFIVLKPTTRDGVTFLGRRFFSILNGLDAGKAVPVMFWFRYPAAESQDEDDVVVRASADFGSLFIDGFGDGILWDSDIMSPQAITEASFNLLQASRMRISKTEFISCPSCGRTLFNLQDTTHRIQARTGHLPGVRIAVMGCIVNGPGEMADADFGYVGSGVGKVDLYVNYDCVQRAIPSEIAVEKLVDLIKEHGKWQDPPDAGELVEAEAVSATASM